MEPLLVFESYNFAQLDRSWIKYVWDSSFTTVENVPVNYLLFLESQDMIELLKKTCEIVKNWINENSAPAESEEPEAAAAAITEVSWEMLLALNLDVRALLAVLAYFIKKGQEFNADQDTRKSCLRATSLYFVLLSIPGSNAFQAFHTGLYEAALKTLTLTKRLVSPDNKTAKKSQSDLPEIATPEDKDGEGHCGLSQSECRVLVEGLNGVVFDLVTMLGSAFTKLEPRSLETTVFYLVELTKLADETISEFSRARTVPASASSLAYNAYNALRLLCNPKYATIAITTRIIGKYVLPQFLVGNVLLPARQMTMIRESTIHFLKTLLRKYGREVHVALVTLIQHLMIKSPERLEGRQKQAIVVIKLMHMCQQNGSVYTQCLKDLVHLSYHSKISCRIFAQEIIGKYLLDLASSQSDSPEDEGGWPKGKKTKLLLAAALSRCADSSSMVRGRAIATLAEYTDSIEDPQVREIFRYEADSEATEMPSLEELVRAVEDSNVENLLPNYPGIIAMLRRRGEDERALVRRSSLQVLRNGILVTPELLTAATPLIREHCRDSALTVRRFAIRVLTTLLERFPDNSSLCKDWVDSVVPRVFDAETKVQEEVLEALQKLTIDKIAHSNSHGENAHRVSDLPWRILNELVVNKMGDHLAKACGIWSNGGTIESSTISSIKSHIGTENNAEAWVLLASIAEHRPLAGMTNYYSYYEKALRDDSNESGFSSSVVIHVLRHCWPSFDDEALRKIQEDMLKYLKQFRVRVALISHCMDILHGIGTFRSVTLPEGVESAEATMRDLMRLSEETITRSIEEETSPEKDPGKLLFRATCTLGHASFLSSAKISHACLRILQGFLLQWDCLPARVRARRELQGAAVTVLGQQALRDREVAQEMTPIFGKLLRNTCEDSPDAKMANGSAVRINTAKALADICVRFTALVEPYLPDMCVSMKDANPEVRQVILVIFIQLLAEDFIKINGPFFFYILSMLNDSDSTIRQMTVFLVKERLLTKNKSLVTQQFVDCIFHLNDYERRTTGNSQRKRRAKERAALAHPGEAGVADRRMIYDFLLEHLEAPGKLTVLAGLTRQILQSTCNAGRPRLSELNVRTHKGIHVFRDALYVLSSEALQPNSCVKPSADDDNMDDNAAAATTVKTSAAVAVIIEAMKKHRLQKLLPGLVELRQRLSRAKSPLVADAARFIGSLLNDYTKDQLETLYNEYPRLEREIERDIREKFGFLFSRERERAERVTEEERPESVSRKKREVATSSTPRKSKFDAALLVKPDWMPRIVLRRISTLTYPEISGLRARATSDSDTDGGASRALSPSARGRVTPRKARSSEPESAVNRPLSPAARGEVTPRKTRSSESESAVKRTLSSSARGEVTPRKTRPSVTECGVNRSLSTSSRGEETPRKLRSSVSESSAKRAFSPPARGRVTPQTAGSSDSESAAKRTSSPLISGQLSSPRVVLRRLSIHELPRIPHLRSFSESGSESGARDAEQAPSTSTSGEPRVTRSSSTAKTGD